MRFRKLAIRSSQIIDLEQGRPPLRCASCAVPIAVPVAAAVFLGFVPQILIESITSWSAVVERVVTPEATLLDGAVRRRSAGAVGVSPFVLMSLSSGTMQRRVYVSRNNTMKPWDEQGPYISFSNGTGGLATLPLLPCHVMYRGAKDRLASYRKS